METNTLNADELRRRILEKFEQFKPHVTAYQEYATQVHALALEYHLARLEEKAPLVELTLLGTLPSHETPKSLDVKLDQLAENGVVIRQVIFDRVGGNFYLFA